MRFSTSVIGSVLLFGLMSASCLNAQKGNESKLMDQTISQNSTQKIIETLASDDMRGRKFGTPDIKKAGRFIADAFKEAGLEPAPKNQDYFQKFSVTDSKITQKSYQADGKAASTDNFIIVSCQPSLEVSEKSGYEVIKAATRNELFDAIRVRSLPTTNAIVLLDPQFKSLLPRLASYQHNQFKSDYTTIFLIGNKLPQQFKITANNQLDEKALANIVGILPGTTKKDELVIFSGHYDHLGVDPNNKEDSIYNGANDDASGITAVIQLAKYYAKWHQNKRTLVFAAFTAEEAGGFGSKYFSRQFDPAKVMAMFNIEMIGTDSKWGNNAAYITGFEKTDMGTILQKNLEGTDFKFHPDPYTKQHLFYRSDNATLARQGVAAHTISTSKMDAEPNYHKVTDEISTLNLKNMNQIIRSIALSAKSIISGQDTPSRVDTKQLD